MSSRPLRWFTGLIGGLVVMSLVTLLPIGGGTGVEAQSYGAIPAQTQQTQQTSQIQQIQDMLSRLLGIGR